MSTTTTARERLKDVENEIAEARDRQVQLRAALDEAKAQYARVTNPLPHGPETRAAERAQADLRAHGEHERQLTEEQIGLLRQIGRGGAGFDAMGGSGWPQVATGIDLPAGRTRVDQPLSGLLHGRALAADVTVSPGSEWSAPAVQAPFRAKARDERHVWRVFPMSQLEPEVLAVTDFHQSGTREVIGDPIRDPMSTGEKAALKLAVTLETPSVKQLAITLSEIPQALFTSVPLWQAFCESELAYQLALALDVHCIDQITSGAPPHGATGATLIEQVRNAVSAMRAVGGNPTVLAVSPAAAAELDLLKTGGEGLEQYVFASRATGSASPLWGLDVVEVPGLEAPVLLDPTTLGVLYAGSSSVLVNPYTEMQTNEVMLRLEFNCLLHVRDAVAGAYIVEA